MAILASSQNGDFTASSTWSVVDNTSYLNSEGANQVVTNTYVNSAGFTPGAITIDGIGVRVLQTQTVPVGTFSVRLTQGATGVAGTEVTINVSDIPNGTAAVVGWVFFKFPAPVTLAAATAYSVSLRCSTNSQVTAYRTATTNNWSRFLRTATNAAPVAADTLIVCGDYTDIGTSSTTTVTMDNTADVTFGALDVSAKGVLSFATTPSTDLLFKTNQIARVTGAGSLEIGTLSSPIPTSSTASFNLVNATNVSVGLLIVGVSLFTTYGAVKTGRAYLNADIASLATSSTTDITTNWLNGDTIAIASTTITPSQTESVTLTANATGTSVPTTTTSFAHSGTAPTKAEIVNLTRNVKIFGTSISQQTYIFIAAFPTVSINYTEFMFMGSATTSRRGIDVSSLGIGSSVFNGCAFREFTSASSVAINLGTSVENTTVQDCVFYRINAQAVSFSSSAQASVSVTNCWAFTNFLAGNSLFSYSSPLPTLSGVVAVSARGFGIGVSTNNFANDNLSNLTTHSNESGGLSIVINSQNSTPPVISNVSAWKNNGRNISINNCNNIVFDTITVFGSSIVNLEFTTTASTDLTFKNMSCFGGVSPSTAEGIRFLVSCDKLRFIDCIFGDTISHVASDVGISFVRGFLGANFYNCEFLSAVPVAGMSAISYNSYIASSNHNNVLGAFQTYTPIGIVAKDTVIFDTSTLGLGTSSRLVPSSFASKLTIEKVIAVPAGRQLRITAAVRQSSIANGAVYNGALPDLVLKKNHSLGVLNDAILATATVASAGAFEYITGTTPIATDDGAFTICARCDGTAGWVNFDSFKVEVI